MDILLVGAAGYGAHYLDVIERSLDFERNALVAAVDPFVPEDKLPPAILARGTRLFRTMEDFFAQGRADLAVICSPIQFHAQQVKAALEQGCTVLCEKPVTATVEEAMGMLAARREAGLPVGVGFQWSFSPAMQALKRDIMAGVLGRPLSLRTYVSWKRPDAYYNGWKGRRFDDAGRPVMDSIAMNATAHHLHNILFLMGPGLDAAALPGSLEAMLYRGRGIETYDTCFLRGRFENGCQLVYVVSHVGQRGVEPTFTYEFEKAVASYDEGGDRRLTARFTDGSVKDYGLLTGPSQDANKLLAMMRCAETGEAPVCGIETALPHLRVCEAMGGQVPVAAFPAGLRVVEQAPAGVHIPGLNEAMETFYQSGQFPTENQYPWAVPSTPVSLEG